MRLPRDKKMAMRFVAIASCASYMLAVSISGFAADPLVGTWKLTKTTQAGRHIGEVLKMEVRANGGSVEIVANDEIGSNGEMVTALVNEPPTKRVVSRPNSHTIKLVFSQNGKYVGTLKREVSANGRVLTQTIDLLSPNGEKFHSVDTYEKQ
jgi:hypothetical protein